MQEVRDELHRIHALAPAIQVPPPRLVHSPRSEVDSKHGIEDFSLRTTTIILEERVRLLRQLMMGEGTCLVSRVNSSGQCPLHVAVQMDTCRNHYHPECVEGTRQFLQVLRGYERAAEKYNREEFVSPAIVRDSTNRIPLQYVASSADWEHFSWDVQREALAEAVLPPGGDAFLSVHANTIITTLMDVQPFHRDNIASWLLCRLRGVNEKINWKPNSKVILKIVDRILVHKSNVNAYKENAASLLKTIVLHCMTEEDEDNLRLLVPPSYLAREREAERKLPALQIDDDSDIEDLEQDGGLCTHITSLFCPCARDKTMGLYSRVRRGQLSLSPSKRDHQQQDDTMNQPESPQKGESERKRGNNEEEVEDEYATKSIELLESKENGLESLKMIQIHSIPESSSDVDVTSPTSASLSRSIPPPMTGSYSNPNTPGSMRRHISSPSATGGSSVSILEGTVSFSRMISDPQAKAARMDLIRSLPTWMRFLDAYRLRELLRFYLQHYIPLIRFRMVAKQKSSWSKKEEGDLKHALSLYGHFVSDSIGFDTPVDATKWELFRSKFPSLSRRTDDELQLKSEALEARRLLRRLLLLLYADGPMTEFRRSTNIDLEPPPFMEFISVETVASRGESNSSNPSSSPTQLKSQSSIPTIERDGDICDSMLFDAISSLCPPDLLNYLKNEMPRKPVAHNQRDMVLHGSRLTSVIEEAALFSWQPEYTSAHCELAYANIVELLECGEKIWSMSSDERPSALHWLLGGPGPNYPKTSDSQANVRQMFNVLSLLTERSRWSRLQLARFVNSVDAAGTSPLSLSLRIAETQHVSAAQFFASTSQVMADRNVSQIDKLLMQEELRRRERNDLFATMIVFHLLRRGASVQNLDEEQRGVLVRVLQTGLVAAKTAHERLSTTAAPLKDRLWLESIVRMKGRVTSQMLADEYWLLSFVDSPELHNRVLIGVKEELEAQHILDLATQVAREYSNQTVSLRHLTHVLFSSPRFEEYSSLCAAEFHTTPTSLITRVERLLIEEEEKTHIDVVPKLDYELSKEKANAPLCASRILDLVCKNVESNLFFDALVGSDPLFGYEMVSQVLRSSFSKFVELRALSVQAKEDKFRDLLWALKYVATNGDLSAFHRICRSAVVSDQSWKLSTAIKHPACGSLLHDYLASGNRDINFWRALLDTGAQPQLEGMLDPSRDEVLLNWDQEVTMDACPDSYSLPESVLGQPVTVLMMACHMGLFAVVSDLVREQAVDVGVMTNNNMSALHFACNTLCHTTEDQIRDEANRIIVLLLRHNANPSQVDRFGKTPLHYLLGGDMNTQWKDGVPDKVMEVVELLNTPTQQFNRKGISLQTLQYVFLYRRRKIQDIEDNMVEKLEQSKGGNAIFIKQFEDFLSISSDDDEEESDAENDLPSSDDEATEGGRSAGMRSRRSGKSGASSSGGQKRVRIDAYSTVFEEHLFQHIVNLIWTERVRPKLFYRLVRYLIFLALMVVSVLYLGHGRYPLESYYMHETLTDTFVHNEVNYLVSLEPNKNFKNLFNIEEVWDWIQGPLFDGLYFQHNAWRDEEQTAPQFANSTEYVMGYNRLLSTPRIRQLRVKQSQCTRTRYVDGFTEPCFPRFSEGDEEKGRISSSLLANDSSLLSAFSHSRDEDEGEYYLGEFASYPSGGYIFEFPRNEITAKENLAALRANHWLDLQTRIVMVEFTLHNPSLDLLTLCRLSIETSAAGTVRTLYSFEVYKTLREIMKTEPWLVVLESVIYLGILSYIVFGQLPLLLRSNYHGKFSICGFKGTISEYWTANATYVEWTLYLVFICLFILRWVIRAELNDIVSEFEGVDLSASTYVDFHRISDLLLWESYLVAIVFVILFTNALIYLYVFRVVSLFVLMLKRMVWEYVQFLFFLLVVVVGFSGTFLIIFNSGSIFYRDFFWSLFTVLNGALTGSDLRIPIGAGEFREIGPILIFVFSILVALLMVNLLIAILNTAYSKVKRELGHPRWCYEQYKMIHTYYPRLQIERRFLRDLSKVCTPLALERFKPLLEED